MEDKTNNNHPRKSKDGYVLNFPRRDRKTKVNPDGTFPKRRARNGNMVLIIEDMEKAKPAKPKKSVIT